MKALRFGLIVSTFLTFSLISISTYGATLVVKSTLTEIISYAEWGGAVLIKVSTALPAGSCADGFFVNPTATGFENVMSVLLASFYSGREVEVIGYDDRPWHGAPTFCELGSVKAL